MMALLMVNDREKCVRVTLFGLLRTVYSIVGNTSTNLQREVILVDDGSVMVNNREKCFMYPVLFSKDRVQYSW